MTISEQLEQREPRPANAAPTEPVSPVSQRAEHGIPAAEHGIPASGGADDGATALPRRGMPALGETIEERIVVGASMDDRLSLGGAAIAGLALSGIMTIGLKVVGLGWTPLLAYLWFVVMFYFLTRMTLRGPAVRDHMWTILLWSAGVVVVAALALVVVFTVTRGADVYSNLNFFTQDMGGVGPLDPLTEGGIVHAIIATLEQITIALIICVPLGVLTAVFLNEVGGRFARFVRTIVEAMTALPSVVAGLFIYAAVVMVAKQYSGFAAALSISVLMLPIMIRSADVVLRLVPGNLREAGYALGASQWSVVRYIVLPTVRSGLVTAIILGTAHGIGETAPVMLTAGSTKNLNVNPFQGPQTPLPLAALEFIKSPKPAEIARGYATAAFLLFLVLILFALARALGGQAVGDVSARQLRRRARQSQAIAARMLERPAATDLGSLFGSPSERPGSPPPDRLGPPPERPGPPSGPPGPPSGRPGPPSERPPS